MVYFSALGNVIWIKNIFVKLIFLAILHTVRLFISLKDGSIYRQRGKINMVLIFNRNIIKNTTKNKIVLSNFIFFDTNIFLATFFTAGMLW